jgi:hypothetical protein
MIMYVALYLTGGDMQRRRFTALEKQAHVKQWRASGLTQQQYCAQAKLNHHSFKNWGRRHKPREAISFIPAQVHQSIVVEHPRGVRVTVPAACLTELLTVLITC